LPLSPTRTPLRKKTELKLRKKKKVIFGKVTWKKTKAIRPNRKGCYVRSIQGRDPRGEYLKDLLASEGTEKEKSWGGEGSASKGQ